VSERITVVARAAPRPLLRERHVEMCEHKGIGHPDTITDAVCEAVARELASSYQREFGQILHFNVDKGLLIAGRSEPCFGGGRITKPVKIIVAGRAANPDGRLNLRDIAVEAARRYLRSSIRADTEEFLVVPEIEEGSASLQQIYASRRAVAIANDTSFGVGFAPLSELEQKVLQLASALKSSNLRTEFPAAGDDFKIMGLRTGDAFEFTFAVAVIDKHVENAEHYFEIKQHLHDYLAGKVDGHCTLCVNALDDPAARDESGLYLTVSGLSAEMGDDGQVGRGNRVNGLITPGRAMSLEAAAGKNPRSHVGKIYGVLAHDLAEAICKQVPEVSEANVQLLSRIGQPIDRPQMVVVELAAEGGVTQRLQDRVAEIANGLFDRIAELTDRLARGDIPLY
jgi:S-adenosylmethionine synthetase